MGIVYLGRDPVIGRLVALKTIRATAEDDAEQREFGERFLREAQAAGILSHPNIVTIHDVGEDPETHVSFIAMEYVEGKNVKQLLQEKTVFPYERIAEIKSKGVGAWDKLEKVFEDRVARALHSLNVPTKKDIDTLSKRVAELTEATNKLADDKAAKKTVAKA